MNNVDVRLNSQHFERYCFVSRTWVNDGC